MAIGALIGAGVGAIAGAQGSSTSQSYVSGIKVAPETALEKQATKSLEGALSGYESIVNAGPGTQAGIDAMGSNKSLQDMLKQYAAGGFMPTQQDMSTANQYATDVFKPQAVMQQQQFEQQSQQANRLAAQLNRPVNDPIIQAKLRQEQMRQADVLGAQQTSFGAQYAQQMPGQRLGFTQQLADVNNNLASQAMANRQALLSLGSTLREQDRSYRINTGEKYGNYTTSSGGGLGGALTGALAGFGTGAASEGAMTQFGKDIKGWFSGGGAAAGGTDYEAAMAAGHGGSGPGTYGTAAAAAPAPIRQAAQSQLYAPQAASFLGGGMSAGTGGGYSTAGGYQQPVNSFLAQFPMFGGK